MLDLGTVLFLHETSLLAGAGLLWLVWLRAERPQGIASVAVAYFLLAVGAFFAGLGEVGMIPANVWRGTSPALGAAAYIFLLIGIHQFDRPVRRLYWLLLVALGLLVIGQTTDAFANNLIRATVFHLSAAVSLLVSGAALSRRHREEPLPSRIPLAVTLILCGSVYAIQIPFLLTGLASKASLAWSFSATLMLNFAIAALVISFVRERKEERHRRLSITDALTGVPNRLGFLTLVPEMLGAGSSVAIVDLDHFKRVNDRFGHAAGDHVLSVFAKLASRHLRPGEVLARIGGEEFVIYLPDGSGSRAERLAEEIGQALRSTPVPWQDDAIRITASFGLALLDPWEPDERETAVALADAAVYQAKAKGRDCVVVCRLGESSQPPAEGVFCWQRPARAAR